MEAVPRVRDIISFLVALALAVQPLAHAQNAGTAGATPAPDHAGAGEAPDSKFRILSEAAGAPGEKLQFTTELVKPGREGERLREILDEGDRDAKVYLIHSGPEDSNLASVSGVLALQDGAAGRVQNIDLSTNADAYTHANADTKKSLWRSAVNKVRKFYATKTGYYVIRSAITVGTATAYGAVYWWFSNDIPEAFKLGGLALVANSTQILFPSIFHHYVQGGGKFTKWLWSRLNDTTAESLKTGHVSGKLGEILAIIGFSGMIATTVMLIQGGITNAFLLGTLAAAGTWDMNGDLPINRLIESGKLNPNRLVIFRTTRLAFGPVLDAIAFSGGPYSAGAMIVMTLIGSTAVIAYLKSERLIEYLNRREAERVDRPEESLWRRSISAVKNTASLAADSIDNTCEKYLSFPPPL
jgi:hypothetical protein